jgi:hypothetical protein
VHELCKWEDDFRTGVVNICVVRFVLRFWNVVYNGHWNLHVLFSRVLRFNHWSDELHQLRSWHSLQPFGVEVVRRLLKLRFGYLLRGWSVGVLQLWCRKLRCDFRGERMRDLCGRKLRGARSQRMLKLRRWHVPG